MSRSALVTGGTGGIGSAIVRRLRANGYEVVFCGRDEQRGAALERETGAVFFRRGRHRPRGLRRLGRIRARAARTRRSVRRQRRACSPQGPLAATTDEEFERLVETNLTSTFRYGRALFAPMRRAGRAARWC